MIRIMIEGKPGKITVRHGSVVVEYTNVDSMIQNIKAVMEAYGTRANNKVAGQWPTDD